MRCTVAPIKSSKAPSARCPKLKMPDSVFKPGICGKLQQLATPNLQNLGLWEVGSLKLCDAPVTKQTPRFGNPVQKQNTEAPSIHLASKSRSHRSHSIRSIDLSHFLDLKSRNWTNRTNSWTTSFGSLHLHLHHIHHLHQLHPQQTPATWMHHSRPGPHFSWSWCSLWKACTSKLDTHSTHYWKILDI